MPIEMPWIYSYYFIFWSREKAAPRTNLKAMNTQVKQQSLFGAESLFDSSCYFGGFGPVDMRTPVKRAQVKQQSLFGAESLFGASSYPTFGPVDMRVQVKQEYPVAVARKTRQARKITRRTKAERELQLKHPIALAQVYNLRKSPKYIHMYNEKYM